MSSEHRSETRKKVFLKGRILFNNGASSMDCLVRDLSESGARLSLSESSTLPDVFDLYIPQKERNFRATLRWRRTDGIGVTFADAKAPDAPDAALTILLQRVNDLEAENAALRRLLATLAPNPAGAA